MGTTQSAIARLESGAGKPSIATLQRYAGALGYRVEIRFLKSRSQTSRATRHAKASG
ncbi:MAG: helix-turn-helix transcriptional regulator [Gammaproteobacteria bacterium]|nr:helix-turn-helix transcriptional regulator [Gammaproteobacteria bacterium]